MARSHPSPDSPSPEYQPLWTLVLRLSWLAVGPAALMLFIMNMAIYPHAGIAVRDAIYAAVALLVIALRWIDFRFGEPRFDTGQHSTVSQVRRHSLVVAGAAAASWIVVRAWGVLFVPQ